MFRLLYKLIIININLFLLLLLFCNSCTCHLKKQDYTLCIGVDLKMYSSYFITLRGGIMSIIVADANQLFANSFIVISLSAHLVVSTSFLAASSSFFISVNSLVNFCTSLVHCCISARNACISHRSTTLLSGTHATHEVDSVNKH